VAFYGPPETGPWLRYCRPPSYDDGYAGDAHSCGAATESHRLPKHPWRLLFWYGDPGKIRTCDLRFRKPLLYPSELRGHPSDSLQVSIHPIPRPTRSTYPALTSDPGRYYLRLDPSGRSPTGKAPSSNSSKAHLTCSSCKPWPAARSTATPSRAPLSSALRTPCRSATARSIPPCSACSASASSPSKRALRKTIARHASTGSPPRDASSSRLKPQSGSSSPPPSRASSRPPPAKPCSALRSLDLNAT
jgi:hypothetical protein